jgi:streptogramin lyase
MWFDWAMRLRALAPVSLLVAFACTQTEPAPPPSRSPSPSPSPSVVTTPSGHAVREYAVPAGSHPHDVAPATSGGGVWFTAQSSGELGLLDPASGRVQRIRLGDGSAPHGVVVGPDGAAWVTDAGLNAIVRVDARTHALRAFRFRARTRA